MSKIDFIKDLSNFLKARFPFIYINTYEEERVIKEIENVCNREELIKTPRRVYEWSITSGFYHNNRVVDGSVNTPIKALEYIEGVTEPAVFILKDFHVNFGVQSKPINYEVVRKLRDMIIPLKHNPKPKNIIFVSPVTVLPDELQKDITFLDFDLPTKEDITDLLDDMIAINSSSGRIRININQQEKEQLVKAALGLTFQEAENAFARALVKDGVMDIDDVQVILKEKSQVIKKTGILEYINTNLNMNDVGGLENIKRWLRKRNKSWLDSAKKYSLSPPKGVLITGIPGCGKSLIAKAVSSMWQLPLLRLDMGKIYNGLLGSSEENIRRAIKTAEAVAPSILWVDEIEKGLSNSGSGDSGTSSRIFGTFLTWMQEKTKPVFVVSTANNIDKLPPELLRKGRFDEIFFADLPTFSERKAIFKVHMKKRLTNPQILGGFQITDDVITDLAQKTEGFVGAEIENIVITALYEAFFEDRCIDLDDFYKSISNTVPLSVTQAEQIKAIRDWANVRAVAATPKEDRSHYKVIDKVIPEKKPTDDDISSNRGGRTIDF